MSQEMVNNIVKKIKKKDGKRGGSGRGFGLSYKHNSKVGGDDRPLPVKEKPSDLTQEDIDNMKEDTVNRLSTAYDEAKAKGLSEFQFDNFLVAVNDTVAGAIVDKQKTFGKTTDEAKKDTTETKKTEEVKKSYDDVKADDLAKETAKQEVAKSDAKK